MFKKIGEMTKINGTRRELFDTFHASFGKKGNTA